MKSYLVEFEAVVCRANPLRVIRANCDEDAWIEATKLSEDICVESGNFDMYQILRNPDGELYLADLFGDAITSSGRMV